MRNLMVESGERGRASRRILANSNVHGPKRQVIDPPGFYHLEVSTRQPETAWLNFANLLI
jgi:hypothetical protein